MKKQLGWVLIFCALSVLGVDYSLQSNWVICDSAAPTAEQRLDVFYIYPTLFRDKDVPLMDWSDAKLAHKTVAFSAAQAGMWGKQARVFAPYVRQAELDRCIADIKPDILWEDSIMAAGVKDTLAAFEYYLEHYNRGRPYILLGHSQGAMDLYCLLKLNTGISKQRGFTAAYLAGLPGITAERFAKDFAGRDIVPGENATDAGVVLIWNTQCRQAEFSIFSGPGVLCINPLNWKTDATPAGANENLGANLYNYRTEKPNPIPAFCGACVDPAKGALIVDFPPGSPYFEINPLGKGICHSYDIFFFYENIRSNALTRAETWQRTRGGAVTPE